MGENSEGSFECSVLCSKEFEEMKRIQNERRKTIRKARPVTQNYSGQCPFNFENFLFLSEVGRMKKSYQQMEGMRVSRRQMIQMGNPEEKYLRTPSCRLDSFSFELSRISPLRSKFESSSELNAFLKLSESFFKHKTQ